MRNGELLLNGNRVSVLQNKKVLEMGIQQCEYVLLNYIVKNG